MGRVQTFDDLARVEQLFRDFFRTAEIGLAIFDNQLRYRGVNQPLARMHRRPVEWHLGKTVSEVLGDVGTRVEPVFRGVLNSGEPLLNYEVAGPLPTKPEGGHWVDNIFPIMDVNGKIAQVSVVVVEMPKQAALSRTETSVASPILRSWKEIADYVGTCVKTVQRWEHSHNFPARRLQRSKGAAVFALKAEVDCWVETSICTRRGRR
jgi:PAS domain-containing protein